jgi:hypothetical protein
MGASIRSGRSVRFSHDTSLQSEADFTRWPGVYIHPGHFVHAADRPRDQEAWERARSRLKRLKTRVCKTKDGRSQSHGKHR